MGLFHFHDGDVAPGDGGADLYLESFDHSEYSAAFAIFISDMGDPFNFDVTFEEFFDIPFPVNSFFSCFF